MSAGGSEHNNLNQINTDSPEKLQQFEERISQGDLVESWEWLPEDYRDGMLELAEHQANSEIMRVLSLGEWITRAPSMRRKQALIARVQDGVGHAQLFFRVAEDLGKPRGKLLGDLCEGHSSYHHVFNYPLPTWGDVCVILWLLEGAEFLYQKSLAQGSYAPFTRTLNRVIKKKAFHARFGEELVLTMMSGTEHQRGMMQAAFDRWWGPTLMFFCPPDVDSDSARQFKCWRMETAPNENLRLEFVTRFAPAAKALGLKVHLPGPDNKDPAKPNSDLVEDPLCCQDEVTGRWGISEPDWEEFWRVVRGDGPCNQERLGLQRFCYEQGRWVRDAVGTGPGKK